jgi:signal transduction histidine kinase
VTITDTGSGMSHPTLERIWDPFYSERSDGTGLGLSIVKTVVERHAGSVSASSAPGRGTVMAVTLPRDAEEGRA